MFWIEILVRIVEFWGEELEWCDIIYLPHLLTTKSKKSRYSTFTTFIECKTQPKSKNLSKNRILIVFRPKNCVRIPRVNEKVKGVNEGIDNVYLILVVLDFSQFPYHYQNNRWTLVTSQFMSHDSELNGENFNEDAEHLRWWSCKV